MNTEIVKGSDEETGEIASILARCIKRNKQIMELVNPNSVHRNHSIGKERLEKILTYYESCSETIVRLIEAELAIDELLKELEKQQNTLNLFEQKVLLLNEKTK